MKDEETPTASPSLDRGKMSISKGYRRSPASKASQQSPMNRSKLFSQRCRESLRKSKKDDDECLKKTLRELISSRDSKSFPIEAPPLMELDDESNSVSEELIDYEEQKRLVEHFEEQKRISDLSNCSNSNTVPVLRSGEANGLETPRTSSSSQMVELTPGIMIPLRDAAETWDAIRSGNVVSTLCCCCKRELTSIDDAEYLVCAECWVFNRVHKKTAFIAGGQSRNSYGACIGVTPDDIAEWLME